MRMAMTILIALATLTLSLPATAQISYGLCGKQPPLSNEDAIEQAFVQKYGIEQRVAISRPTDPASQFTNAFEWATQKFGYKTTYVYRVRFHLFREILDCQAMVVAPHGKNWVEVSVGECASQVSNPLFTEEVNLCAPVEGRLERCLKAKKVCS